jgi:hypothetical protein
MNKHCPYFLLLFTIHIASAMDLSEFKIPRKPQEKLEQRVVTYSNPNKLEQKKYLPEPKTPLYLNSKIRKPHCTKKTPVDFIYDRYTARRGIPKMLDIHCNECGDILIKYQKDGPGRLLRCYLDRIHAPISLKGLQYERFDIKTSPYLSCEYCRLIIGKPMIYAPESRPAYHLVHNSFYIKECKE